MIHAPFTTPPQDAPRWDRPSGMPARGPARSGAFDVQPFGDGAQGCAGSAQLRNAGERGLLIGIGDQLPALGAIAERSLATPNPPFATFLIRPERSRRAIILRSYSATASRT
jgi:hypothetical protein